MKSVIDYSLRCGYFPESPSEFLGTIASYLHQTKGIPIEMTKDYMQKDLKQWMMVGMIGVVIMQIIKRFGWST